VYKEGRTETYEFTTQEEHPIHHKESEVGWMT